MIFSEKEAYYQGFIRMVFVLVALALQILNRFNITKMIFKMRVIFLIKEQNHVEKKYMQEYSE